MTKLDLGSTERLQKVHSTKFAYAMLACATGDMVVAIPTFYSYHFWLITAAHVLDFMLIVPMFYYLHKTGRTNVVLWVICVASVIASTSYVLEGGIDATGTEIAIGGLLVAFLLKGTSALKLWAVGAYPIFVALLVLHLFGVAPLPYPVAAYVVFLVGNLLATIMLWFYGSTKESLDRQLADRTKELEIAKANVERKVEERTHELHDARAYLVSSINSLGQGFILVDGNGHIVLANVAARKLWDSHAASQDSVALSDLPAIAWDIDLPKMVNQVLRHGRTHQLPASTKGGSYYQVYATPVIAEQNVLGATIVIQDVTEQRILDRSRDEFFSIASHELRTPLTAIRGNMSMLKDYSPEAMKDPMTASMVDDTHAASIRLIEIVNDFLDTSSLEQGKMAFNLVRMPIEPSIDSICEDLHSMADKQHDTIQTEGLDKIPLVIVDEARLRQIIYNLLVNAIKYCENATITIAAHADEKNVYIRVIDTGKGISAENQKLLFHKFQQAGESILTRDDTKGTGLGLYISKLLAVNMHGDVALERSEVGKGSTFVLVLPIAK